MFVLNKQAGTTYLENSEINEILIDDGSNLLDLGDLVSITNNKVIKTGGVNLTTYLNINDAVKIDNEIKRVKYIQDNNTFYTTKSFLDTHTAGVAIYKNFIINSNFVLNKDNFNNDVMPVSLTSSSNEIFSCTEFSGCDSLFLYSDSSESYITGTYDETNLENVDTIFSTKINETIKYIINMRIFEGELNDEYYVNVTSKERNVYKVKLNGKNINSSDYVFDGEKITITNSDILRNYNYITVYHYPTQSVTGVTIKLNYKSYDQVFINDTTVLDEFYFLNFKSAASSTPSYEFYEALDKKTKNKIKVRVNSNNTITFTSMIGEDLENEYNITKHLLSKLTDKNNFRLIRKYNNIDSIDYWYNCKLLNPTPYTEEDGADNISYTIEFLEHVKIKGVTWGEYAWGETYWGVECEVRE